MIYLDNSATTCTRPEVAKFLHDTTMELFYNPSSVYAPAIQVKLQLDQARVDLITCLDAPRDGSVYFTGSATEANNIILRGLIKKHKKALISIGDHPSVFEVAKALELQGYDIEYIRLTPDGVVDEDNLLQLLDSGDVGFVSFMHVSNETGAINDIVHLSKLIKSKHPKCVVHCDGVQAFAKVPFSLSASNVDVYTVSSHKIHGPKGVGAFYIRKGINISPSIFGGGQESGVRPGTENVPGILAFVLAAKIMKQKLDANYQHASQLKSHMIAKLNQKCSNFTINAINAPTSPNVLSVSFDGVRGEVILHALEEYEIYVSTGSACSSRVAGNRILQAMGQSKNKIQGNIRFSFSEFNTLSEVDTVVDCLVNILDKFNSIRK